MLSMMRSSRLRTWAQSPAEAKSTYGSDDVIQETVGRSEMKAVGERREWNGGV